MQHQVTEHTALQDMFFTLSHERGLLWCCFAVCCGCECSFLTRFIEQSSGSTCWTILFRTRFSLQQPLCDLVTPCSVGKAPHPRSQTLHVVAVNILSPNVIWKILENHSPECRGCDWSSVLPFTCFLPVVAMMQSLHTYNNIIFNFNAKTKNFGVNWRCCRRRSWAEGCKKAF